MKPTVFLFGESKKGEFATPVACHSLTDLCHYFGDQEEDSLGISYAIQTLLYNKDLIFCRVHEEGFSRKDYMQGFSLLKQIKPFPYSQALFIPGVGDEELLEEAFNVCFLHKSLLVLTEKDLYDYLLSH